MENSMEMIWRVFLGWKCDLLSQVDVDGLRVWYEKFSNKCLKIHISEFRRKKLFAGFPRPIVPLKINHDNEKKN